MRRTLTAFTMFAALVVLLTIARTLRSINYQLTLLSCLYQADHEMVCEAVGNQFEPEPSKEMITHV